MGGLRQSRRRFGGWIAPLTVAVCLAAGPVFAADLAGLRDSREAFERVRVALDSGTLTSTSIPALRTPHSLRLSPRTSLETGGFLKRHLMPRVSQQLERMAPIHALDVERANWENSQLHDWFSGTASHYATRGLRRAARGYLVEETGLGSFIESLRVGGGGSGNASGRPRAGTDYGVRVSHGRPRLEMRRRSGAGTTRFGVGLDGSVKIEFRPANSTNGRFAASYDAYDSSYALSFHHSY